MPITVLLADNSEIARKAIRRLLSNEATVQLVGEASDFTQAIDMLSSLRPQVVVFDLHMPSRAKLGPPDIKAAFGAIPIVAISSDYITDSDTKALSASMGAGTFLDKMNLATELIPAIHDAVLSKKEPSSVSAAS